MKKQQAFNLAYLGVTSQGRPSLDVNGKGWSCLFNGPGGCHCNIGWLMDLHDENIDLDVIASKLHLDKDFLRELQAAHDGAVGHNYVKEPPSKRNKGFLSRYRESMAALAKAHNLKVPLT